MSILDDKELVLILRQAKKAGRYLKSRFQSPLKVSKKGVIDLVTEADLESEKIIVEGLRKSFGYQIISEESAKNTYPEGFYFLVDPLDGTTNFAKNIPFYAVSIALMDNKYPVKAVIFLPEFNEAYIAAKNKGSFLIKGKHFQELRVSRIKSLGDAVLATGFPYDVWFRYEHVLSSIKTMLTKARAVRRFGSAAIDLCYVARGIFDGYFEYSLKPWDTAAGALIVEEAGGKVTDLSGRRFSPFFSEILATNGLIHEELRQELVKNSNTEEAR